MDALIANMAVGFLIPQGCDVGQTAMGALEPGLCPENHSPHGSDTHDQQDDADHQELIGQQATG